ncbi:hypothetical protein BT96DRAFT_916621 [Gymnopus androsaceus JB14]|uniref:Uncharacterized protein n=1 Tax=Gymnopus androsaceus JB14 TaxID=1447944 RepID=A0A6A4I7Q6_9AGAR|nr:hypothetical protein BT96DRAFT_916621 [Gymnopus androsaceus JB14]
MAFVGSLRLAFARTTGFLTVPVTTLLVIVYIAVAMSTLITDQIAPVPSPSTPVTVRRAECHRSLRGPA